ncbi:DsbA family protein [Vibrio sp.]|nr:DsbA family protein [Vibrio sp.]
MKKLTQLIIALNLAYSVNAVAALTPEQDKQLDEINTLLNNNPEIIEGLHTNLQDYINQTALFEKTKLDSKEWLSDTKSHAVIGNPNGKTVVTVFTDYNCPYCKRLENELTKLIAENEDLKVIQVFVPLKQQRVDGLDTNSAVYSTKVWQEAPEKFLDVHNLLVKKNGLHSKASLEAVAKRTGTEKQLEGDSDVDAIMKKNYDTFGALGFRGTPTLMIGETTIPGYLPYDQLKAAIAKEYK